MINKHALRANGAILSFCRNFHTETDVCTFPQYLDRNEDSVKFTIACADKSPLVVKTINSLRPLFVVDGSGKVLCTWLERGKDENIKHCAAFSVEMTKDVLLQKMDNLALLVTATFSKEIKRLAVENSVDENHMFSKIVSIKETQLISYELALENNQTVFVAGNRDDIKEGNFVYIDHIGNMEILPSNSLS